MPRSNRFMSGALALLIGLGLLAGLWQSFAVVFHMWGADSDIADPVLFWQGMHRYGLRFTLMWRYTQDNWLLSVMPVDFLIFSVFGDRPVVVVATGLLAVWAMVGLTGIVIGRERGRLAGCGAAMVLLFAAAPALGNEGFLAYAVSHGVSIVWGLLGLLLSTLWLDRRRAGWLIGAGVCLFVGTISDPWDAAAFAGPIALAGFGLAWLVPRGERRGLLAVGAMAVVALVLAHTRLLGLFGFLPAPSEQIASLAQMGENARFAARYIAVFLNILPGSFGRSGVTPGWVTVGVDCAVFAGIVLLCVGRSWRGAGGMTQRRRLVALTALISTGALLAALVVTVAQQGMVTARYLANLFVMLPILMAACPLGVGRGAWVDRFVVVVVGGLFIVSGVMSNREVWRAGWPPHMRSDGIPKMAAFLTSQGVRFGYGPYWVTEANAMRWVTRGAVTLRPVAYDPGLHRFVPKMVQTLALWYDRPAPEQRVAFVLSPVRGACGADRTCAAAAETQFGVPGRVVRYRGLTMLIYDHPLVVAPP